MAKPNESQFHTLSEVARILRVSSSTIWRWIEAGKLPAYRVGPKNIRIKKEDLDAMVQPARSKQKASVTIEGGFAWEPPTEKELARRQAIVSQILAKSSERNIAPLTTADLIHVVREQERKSYQRMT